MELLVNPASYSNAVDLIKLKVHQINVGTQEFSIRNNCNLTLGELEELVAHKNTTKVFVLVNKFFFEPEIISLEKFLLEICKLNIDGIIFSDMAIPQILFEHHIRTSLIYDPDTLVCNWGQFPFYLQNNISEVSLARELNAKEIDEICQNKHGIRIQLQVGGYPFVMHSRWQLITNFKNTHPEIKDSLQNKKLLVQEETRHHPLIVYEDKDGTHMFASYNLSLIDKIKHFQQIGIDTIRIDSFLHDASWTLQMAQACINAMDNLPFNIPNEEIYSHGFYNMNRRDLVYLLKDDKYE